jgi:hypothetical protein
VNVVVETQPGGHAIELGDRRPVKLRVELGFLVHQDTFPLTADRAGGRLRPK